jgi:broad specificity phosphatase PhoE
MKIFLIRHGETDHNINRITQGHLNIELNKNGIEQAKSIAERLKLEKFDIIYSSDLIRAKVTAENIHKYQSCDIIFDKRLRERNFGIFQGNKSISNDWDKLEGEFWEKKPVGGESILEHIEKVKDFYYEYIYDDDINNKIAIVAHGGTIRAFLKILLDINIKDVIIEKPANTSLYVFERDDNNKWKIILRNCTKHIY